MDVRFVNLLELWLTKLKSNIETERMILQFYTRYRWLKVDSRIEVAQVNRLACIWIYRRSSARRNKESGTAQFFCFFWRLLRLLNGRIWNLHSAITRLHLSILWWIRQRSLEDHVGNAMSSGDRQKRDAMRCSYSTLRFAVSDCVHYWTKDSKTWAWLHNKTTRLDSALFWLLSHVAF